MSKRLRNDGYLMPLAAIPRFLMKSVGVNDLMEALSRERR